MNLKQKVVFSTVLFFVFLTASVIILRQHQEEALKSDYQAVGEESQIIFFYGEGCPHCLLVEKYFNENRISDKVHFVQKEIYHNQKNLQDFLQKTKQCGLQSNSVGVPFLWDGSKCLIGDQNIINFFKQKISE